MKYVAVIVCLLVGSGLFASEIDKGAGQKSLNDQYRMLSSECDLVNGFRMMKLYKMDQLWKSVLDSVHKEQTKVIELKGLIDSQGAEINHLKASLSKLETEKGELTAAVSNVSVFGKTISKSSFVGWGSAVLLILMLAVGVLFMMYRVAFANAHEFKTTKEMLNKEFEEYKYLAVEKQIKLSRELQNYRNRMAELKLM